jgi:hypothetical protein
LLRHDGNGVTCFVDILEAPFSVPGVLSKSPALSASPPAGISFH